MSERGQWERKTQQERAEATAKAVADMDAYLAGFDARQAAEEAAEAVSEPAPRHAKHTDAPCAPLVGRTRQIRDRAAWFYAQFPPRLPVARTAALDAGYQRYISDGLADTDGHFAPLSFDHWARTL